MHRSRCGAPSRALQRARRRCCRSPMAFCVVDCVEIAFASVTACSVLTSMRSSAGSPASVPFGTSRKQSVAWRRPAVRLSHAMAQVPPAGRPIRCRGGDAARSTGMAPPTTTASSSSDDDQDGRAHPAHALAAQFGIEDREHPSLEFLAMRQRQGHRGRGMVADAGDDVEQVLGVLTRTRAEGECQVVAGPLALGAQMSRGGPDQGMEPVQCTGDPAQRVTDEIVPAHMTQLVDQHGGATLGVPFITRGRQHDRRCHEACRERHLHVVAAEQARRGIEAKAVGDLIERGLPRRVVEGSARRTMRRTWNAPHASHASRATATIAQTASRAASRVQPKGRAARDSGARIQSGLLLPLTLPLQDFLLPVLPVDADCPPPACGHRQDAQLAAVPTRQAPAAPAGHRAPRARPHGATAPTPAASRAWRRAR